MPPLIHPVDGSERSRLQHLGDLPQSHFFGLSVFIRHFKDVPPQTVLIQHGTLRLFDNHIRRDAIQLQGRHSPVRCQSGSQFHIDLRHSQPMLHGFIGVDLHV